MSNRDKIYECIPYLACIMHYICNVDQLPLTIIDIAYEK